MNSLLCLCILAAAVQVSLAKDRCTAELKSLNEDHTACLPSPQGSFVPTKEGVSADEKDLIVNTHNEFRRQVQPTAQNMRQMYWDDWLADVAQKWASNCVIKHDLGENRGKPDAYKVGQNIASGGYSNGWESVITAWHDEVQNFTYGVPTAHTVGHYTQVVWADTTLVGCGYAKCQTKDYYVCNYGPAGNLESEKFRPYISGAKAAKCPDSAKDGLCDCGSKTCNPGADFDVSTCGCKCKWEAEWLSDDCSFDCSKAKDNQDCGGKYPKEDCDKYSNLPFNTCPLMCGKCPYAPGTKPDCDKITTCNPGAFFDMSTCGCKCKYEADWLNDDCSFDCSKAKDKAWACGVGKFFNMEKKSCDFDNVPFEYCPVMCGKCP